MKEGGVEMEPTVSEIQMDSKDERRPAEGSPQRERREGKTSRLCFKRRKKAAQALKLKAGPESAEVARKRPPEAGAPDQPGPRGAWTSIKRLVTRRKRPDSSKAQRSFETEVQADIKAKDADLSKKKAKSRLGIPCIRFSRGAKRSHQSRIPDDSDSNIQVQAEAKGLEIQTQTPPDNQAIKVKSTPDLHEGTSQKDGEAVCESHASHGVTSGGNVISVELGLENERSAIQMGAGFLQKETEETKEKQSVQPQPTSPLKSPETNNQHPGASDVLPSPAIPDQHSVEESSKAVLESRPDWKGAESRASAGGEDKPEETELNQTEEIELKQAEDIELKQVKIKLNQAEDIELKQAEIELKQAEDIELKQAKDIELKQAEIELKQAENVEGNQAEEIELKQADNIEGNQAKDIELKQAEDIDIELKQTKDIEGKQAKDIELKQTEDIELKQTEDIDLKQAEDIELKGKEEVELKQTEDIELKQTEDIELKQTEDIELKQTEEVELKQTEDTELKQTEELKLNQAEETELSQTSDLKENGINAEKPKSEECRRMEPIAIIITDTEISEFDVKRSKNVPKQFLISKGNEQVGVFANDSAFEGRTSEQYETLLIETASSLVKNAIQLSVEQLVNEMVSEDNQVNAVLQ